MRRCPVAKTLKKNFLSEIEKVMADKNIGPAEAMCAVVCPSVLGHQATNLDGSCAIRSRLLKMSPARHPHYAHCG